MVRHGQKHRPDRTRPADAATLAGNHRAEKEHRLSDQQRRPGRYSIAHRRPIAETRHRSRCRRIGAARRPTRTPGEGPESAQRSWQIPGRRLGFGTVELERALRPLIAHRARGGGTEMKFDLCIDVDDVERAVAFYGRGLGLTVIEQHPDWAHVKVNDQTIWLMKISAGPRVRSRATIAGTGHRSISTW